MSPNFLHGDFVISMKHSWQKLGVSDVVLVHHTHYGTMIKRICQVTSAGVLLKGDYHESLTTEQMGLVTEHHIIGKVIWQVSPQ